MKIPSSSTYHYLDGGDGWSDWVHKTPFRVSVVNSAAGQSNPIYVTGNNFFKCKRTMRKKLNMPPYCSCGVQKPRYANSTWNAVMSTMFLAWMSSAVLWCLLMSSSGAAFARGSQRTFRLKEKRLKWCFDDLESLGRHHRRSTEAFYVYFCFFYVWRSGHQLLKLYWIWLQHCLPLKPQKGFCGLKLLHPPLKFHF